uniref:SnoaL-like domain-containing protein n=1 Tax=Cyanothece sp. (strain PCC 7425 / ATCC 29141) TaxID=395961 RepID=B8HNZ9_CYAP4
MLTQSTLSTEMIQATIQQYFAASRGSNLVEDMVACFAPDCLIYDPAEGMPLRGKAELRQFFAQMSALFSVVGLTEEFVSINGNGAAVKWHGQGISLTGRDVSFAGIDLFEFNNNAQIQLLRAYWNPIVMLAELQFKV